mgnify:CR=1 FL=1
MLLPINIAAINQAGLLLKKDRILALNWPFLLSNSIFNLLEEINAISIPEKKAENISPNKANKNKKRVDIYKFLFSLLPSPLLTK